MSDSVQHHRRQPTRLPRPWDSSGKNTGVGCHFLLQCVKVKSESEVAQSCLTLSDPMECSPPGSSVHGSFQARVLEWIKKKKKQTNKKIQCMTKPTTVKKTNKQTKKKSTGVGCHCLLQYLVIKRNKYWYVLPVDEL